MKISKKNICFLSSLPITLALNYSQSIFAEETFKKSLFSISDGSSTVLGQGFNKMNYSFATTCISPKNISDPKSISQSTVNYTDNLSEENLRSILKIGVSANVPIKGVDISPEISYSRDASSTKLSRTTTYAILVELGERKLNSDAKNNYQLVSESHDFDNQGKLINPSDFISKCGDEVITSQKLGAKLFITAKLNFNSQQVLNDFEAKVGISVKDILTGGISGNVKFSKIDENTRRQISLSIHGIQYGGAPQNLLGILDQQSVCTLDRINECQNIIDKINQYASIDFRSQLKINEPSSWVIEESITTPYDDLNVLLPDGNQANFTKTSNYIDALSLSQLRIKLNQTLANETNNYTLASSLLKTKYLAIDENRELNNIMTYSQQNIENIHTFVDECYKDIPTCLSSAENKLKSLIVTYNTDMLKETDIGTLLARVQSHNSPLSGQSHRSSNNFYTPQNALNLGLYSSYYFKFLTLDNIHIKDKNYLVSIKCDKPWYYGYDPYIFSPIQTGFEVLGNSFADIYSSQCRNNESIYIADPVNFPFNDFVVELWARY